MNYKKFEKFIEMLTNLPKEAVKGMPYTYLTEFQGKAYLFSSQYNSQGYMYFSMGYISDKLPMGKYYPIDRKRNFIIHNDKAPAEYSLSRGNGLGPKRSYFIHGEEFTEKVFKRTIRVTTLKEKLNEL